MKNYAIVIKFNSFEEGSYSEFYKKLEELKAHSSFTNSFVDLSGLYFVHTDKSAKEIRNMLYPVLNNTTLSQDLLFIFEIGDDFSGYTYYSDIAWLKEHKQKLEL